MEFNNLKNCVISTICLKIYKLVLYNYKNVFDIKNK